MRENRNQKPTKYQPKKKKTIIALYLVSFQRFERESKIKPQVTKETNKR